MPPATYCNPLPLPDYPRGRASANPGEASKSWYNRERDFRETADPTVIYHQGRWYLYPSAGMAYVSDDFVTWIHARIEPYDCGYAPTVVLHQGKFYLTACGSPLWVADNPLGPFTPIGAMLLPGGAPVDKWMDPMLFSDGEELYAYWGLGHGGIKGARLDPGQLNRLATDPRVLFQFNPAHRWEWYGEHNEDGTKSFVEGSWMIKLRGRYYLTYAAPGTEFSSYGMGAYVSEHPLGPFVYQDRNPISHDRTGLVRGPGHGCLVAGPNDTLWAFYTCTVCVNHAFERRIGMDPAGFDEQGNLFVAAASETPQYAPGVMAQPHLGNQVGWRRLNACKPTQASSVASGREPLYAVDESMKTWWQPAEGDAQPTLEVNLLSPFEVYATRVIWAEPQLRYDQGRTPRPIRYRVQGLAADSQTWIDLLDRRDNSTDWLIDYQPLIPRIVSRVRLVFERQGLTMTPGVTDFSLFGQSVHPDV